VKAPAAKVALFLLLAALAVLGYLFLLSALRGRLGVFSAAVPAMAVAALTLVLNMRFLRSERLSLADLGFDKPRVRIPQAAAGFVAGALTAGAWGLALFAVTSASWHKFPGFNTAAAVGSFTFMTFNNAGEELVYRGYLFLLLTNAYGRAAAICGTSILFTLLHIQSGVPWPSALAGVLTSALIFAALFARWQSVPLVLAFHVGTNFVQELAGLRITGLTFVAPHYPSQATSWQSNGVLALVALINLTVALAVTLSARRHAGGASGATSSED
jgi:membrane protease YdiL (CAAX protease family)